MSVILFLMSLLISVDFSHDAVPDDGPESEGVCVETESSSEPNCNQSGDRKAVL